VGIGYARTCGNLGKAEFFSEKYRERSGQENHMRESMEGMEGLSVASIRMSKCVLLKISGPAGAGRSERQKKLPETGGKWKKWLKGKKTWKQAGRKAEKEQR